ncbi:hypothetical protein LG943_26440 [Streptomonospora sp. S1-112]|uniref:Uncharacterized protein n=1 Tax=Streptomonospora mangrovi TaxID=2883123 RepID=A0A9X3NTQ1_9ACTN|nr:hypothetical protein [Streptomonospora mangrovi]MDA0567834.1 hypothetical protein [Streptomonospora mangrovi]
MSHPPYGPPQPPSGPPPTDVHRWLLSQPFPAVQPNLRVILTGDPSALGTDKLAYSINPQLTALLCYRTNPANYEAAVLDVRHTQQWGLTKQDVWFAALHNLAYEHYDLKSFPTSAPNADTPVQVLIGQSWPGSAHVMRLVDVVREPMPYGAVVMLPSPNTMIFAVLRSKRSASLLPFIYNTFQSLREDGDPVTDQMIWWRGGRVTGMSTQADPGGGVGIRQSPEFSFLLDHELPD